MLSDEKQNELLEKIKNVEVQIQNVYYTKDFDIAKKFEFRLCSIKDTLSTINGDTGFFTERNLDAFDEIMQQIEILNIDILNFFQNKTINSNLQDKSIEELWTMLDDIVLAHTQANNNIIQEQEYLRNMAWRVLEILSVQAKRSEEIDLSRIQKYCNIEDFLFIIKQKLIDIAMKQDTEIQKETLKLAKNLEIDSLYNPDLWKTLINIPTIILNGEVHQDEEVQIESINEVSVIKSKRTFLDFIKEKLGIQKTINLPKTTVYTFGDINPYTLEWENVERVVDEFPKKFPRKQTRRLLSIEINDVPYVTQEHELGKYPNLQTITFGRGVTHIGSNVLSYVGNLKYIHEYFLLNELKKRISQPFSQRPYIFYRLGSDTLSDSWETKCFSLNKKGLFDKDFLFQNPFNQYKCMYNSLIKEIKISDSVTEIEPSAFSYLPELQSIIFGNGIKKIPDNCCQFCENLQEIKFPNTLQEIGNFAFQQGLFTNKDIASYPQYFRILIAHYIDEEFMEDAGYPFFYKLRQPILEKYNSIVKYNNIVKIPESVEKIGKFAFYSCHKYENPNKYWTYKCKTNENSTFVVQFPQVPEDKYSDYSKFTLSLTQNQKNKFCNVEEVFSGRPVEVYDKNLNKNAKLVKIRKKKIQHKEMDLDR